VPPISLALFHQLFRPTIRVQLAWKRIPTDARVTVVAATDFCEIDDWYTPWYVDSSGRECGFDAGDARPLTIAEAARSHGSLTQERRARLDRIASELRCTEEPRDVLVATYGLGGRAQLVLDGNHRLTALKDVGGAIRVVGLCLMGPVTAAVLPDLARWEGEAHSP
jgi:hypothetical protein